MGNARTKIVEVEGKGRLKIPGSLAGQAPFAGAGKYLILQGSDFLTIKKINETSPQEKFRAMARRLQKKVKTAKVNAKVITDAIAWARKK